MTITLNGTTGIETPSINSGNIVGQVCFFAMTTAPTGFLACDGSAVSRTTYANLFAAIGTLYGAGDGSTTFNLPDLRGEFIRGWDNGRGVDSGRSFGTAQADELKSHAHAPPAGLSAPWLSNSFSGDGAIDSSNITGPLERNPVSGNTQNTGGAETRPRNVALLACIKV
jgi:microcystin-dependent protein